MLPSCVYAILTQVLCGDIFQDLFVVGSGFVHGACTAAQVNLDLGFGAGGTDQDLGAFALLLQQVGLGQVAHNTLAGLVVHHLGDGLAGQSLGGICPQGVHD